MISNKDIKKYNKSSSYSYTLGAFPTFELLENYPEIVEKIMIHTTAKQEIYDKAEKLCEQNNIQFVVNDKLLEKIREKESCIAAGVFDKFQCQMEKNQNHVVLVNPSDSGNMGTIIRTCAGFGINNLAIIEPAVDIFNPKVVRASMGSLFRINHKYFPSFEEYYHEYGGNRSMYPFMLKGAKSLGSFSLNINQPFSLIFGNEATGLDDSFLEVGQSVLIAHTKAIDSLNLSLAAGIAIYEFTKHYFTDGNCGKTHIMI